MTDAVQALGAEKFVSLTTYKKDGAAVATPMWIGRDGDHLFVWTPVDSWKAKRVRNNPGVALTPCSRGGKVGEGATAVGGVADDIGILLASMFNGVTPFSSVEASTSEDAA